MARQRQDSLRFRLGQAVQVTDVIMSFHTGQVGTVTATQFSDRHRTLDKYVVEFASGIRATFWDIQLRAVAEPAGRNSA